MKVIFTTILLLMVLLCAAQPKQLPISDIKPPSGKNYRRYDCDTSNWRLFKIDYSQTEPYSYYRCISFGMVDDAGWSDAVAYIETEFKQDKLLYGWCKISDTAQKPFFMRLKEMVTDTLNWNDNQVIQ